MRILLIEDDQQTASMVREGLTSHGHEVDVAADGNAGLKKAIVEPFDVLVVDRMLPGLDGLQLVESVRRAAVQSGVILLTAVGGIEDRIAGLEGGADDYLVKPFAMGELLARIAALGRRPPAPKQDAIFRIGALDVDLIRRAVRRGNEAIHLQPREFKLLEIFLRNRGRVVTRSMLLEEMWGLELDMKTSIVQTNVSRLRLKIELPGDPPLIRTVRGVGYMIDAA
jgi:two-component system, OmpR family, response regulator